ncbi:MAG: alpha-glucosidase [Jannaschia sp.]
MTTPWWQSTVGYQIYPRSFCDSNADGIGDIPGITARLGHLSDLGVGFIWLSPVYRSPMVDNGYDISDYRDIAPEFGTLADFDVLLAEARARGIRIVMDLVVNHTSDEHDWFKKARAARDAALRDFYVWRDPAPDGGPPTALQSIFGGPAWTLDAATGQYYLHLFDPRQPDLNWHNPVLRRSIHEMMRWWLERGVAGFRMDVIDLLGKDVDKGITVNGPLLHDHLREMRAAVLSEPETVAIGEVWSATPETALLYCGRDRRELSMVFQFAHVTQRWDGDHGKWQPRSMDLPALKKTLNDWQAVCATDGWNALFWCNHDLPRAVSAFGDDGMYRVASAKMLATVLHLMKGTPFVFQGEEIGMTNAPFTSVDQFRDVETLNFHRIETARGMSEETFLAAARTSSRDNGRTPMQWDDTPGAGFSTGTPWIGINPNSSVVNVARDRADPAGVFARYRALIALRGVSDTVRFGTYVPFAEDHPQVMAYAREFGAERIAVVANFGATTIDFDPPDGLSMRGRSLFDPSERERDLGETVLLGPFEVIAIATPGAGFP